MLKWILFYFYFCGGVGGGGELGDFIKKFQSTVQTNNHAHTGVQWPG